MKLPSFLKALSTILPSHKTRSRLSKRLPGPKVPSKFTRASLPHPFNDEANHAQTQQQQKLCEHCKRELVSAPLLSPSRAAPRRPLRLAPIASPQRQDHLPPRPSPPNLPLPPTPSLCPSQRRAVPDHPKEHDCLLAGSANPCVAPIIAPPTEKDRDALGDHRAEVDDEQDHTESPATLPHDGVLDSAPPDLSVDEEYSPSCETAIGHGKIPWDHILASIPYPNFNKRKRSSSSKHRLQHPHTHLSGIPEEPLRLSTCGEISKDGTLSFKFSASDKAQSTVDEALVDFEKFLNQHADLLELELTLAAGACLPADFLNNAIAKASTRLARFIHVTIRLEGAAAQAQATWIWPPKSQLRVLRLVGIARGGVLPLTQLQGLFLCEEVKPVEIASFLTSLPQLRVLALCLGRAGSKRSFHGPSVLPQLERLDLYVRVDPAAFFACVHMPALRGLGLHVSGHRIRWEDDQLVGQGAN